MDNVSTDSGQFEAKTSPSGRRACLSCGDYHDLALDCVPSSDSGDRNKAEEKPADPFIGKTIAGKYQIISSLGSGGMSKVYKAKQMPINKVVALKILQAHLSQDPDSLRRFKQEAQAASQVSHANVVNVFDFGVESSQAYLVMDYLEGETLAQLLKRVRQLDYREAIPIFVEICDGLAAAHEHGVIHRDMKPSNIVLQNVTEGRRARVVDFGIAKMLDAEAQHLTKTGEVFGSPFYMSPEQCEGHTLDQRSDIYSLGIVFYEVLSGTLPLAGKTAIETMSLHLQSIPQSLQKAAGDEHHIPLALENLVFKMLERHRDKRYASMKEVRQSLKQIEAGASEAISGNISYVRREISRRSKILGGAMVMVAVLGLAAVIAYPHACQTLAQQQYDQAKQALDAGKYAEAEPNLKSAVELSKQARNTVFETKILAALVKVYRAEGKTEQLSAARARRRELIKDFLISSDIDNSSVDALVAASSSADANTSFIGSNTAAVQNSDNVTQSNVPRMNKRSRNKMLAQKPLQAANSDAAGSGSETESVSAQSDSDKNSSNTKFERVNRKAESVSDMRRVAAGSGDAGGPAGGSGNVGAGGFGDGAAGGGGNLGAGNGFSKVAVGGNSKGMNGGNSNGIRAGNSNGFAGVSNEDIGTISGATSGTISAPYANEQPLHASSPRASSLYGSSAPAPSPRTPAPHASPVPLSAALPSPQPSPIPMPSASPRTTSSHAPSPIRLSPVLSAEECGDKLDHLQAIMEIALERNSFAKVKDSADEAISLYSQAQLNADSELAKIYSARAWSQLKLGQKDAALSDAHHAVDCAAQCKALPEAAEAEGVQSLIYLEKGNKVAAQECHNKAMEILKSGVPSKPLLADALDCYNKESKH